MPQKELNNRDKSKRGHNAIDALESIIIKLLESKFIKCYEKDKHYGYESDGYDPKQFNCNFLVTFNDNDKWILNNTTSFRTDRVKRQQWDSLHIKSIDKNIKKSILTYPNGIDHKNEQDFKNFNEKIHQKSPKYYSAIDDVLSQVVAQEEIVKYSLKDEKPGKQKCQKGNNFELFIASILSERKNLDKLNDTTGTEIGVAYDIFKKIVDCIIPNPNKQFEISNIDATSDKKKIGLTPSGGNPKTDVLITVSFKKGNPRIYTISCKKTSKEWVSVHQYSADAFANVLNSNNQDLRTYLNAFQSHGKLKGFQYINQLTSELKKITQKKLIKWVLGGHGDNNFKEKQKANFILVSDNSNIYIHTIDDYAHKLSNVAGGYFGTPFRWTYPSKQKGKYIQLKCKVIKEE